VDELERLRRDVDEHDDRLSALERFRSWVLGGLGVIGIAIAGLFEWLSRGGAK
jgi:hypothetical protein